jgi:hypothetical protein
MNREAGWLKEELMSAPHIELQAEKLFERYGYVWSDWLYAYRRVRRIGRESTQEYLTAPPVVITYEDLKDHGLIVPQYDSSVVYPGPAELNAAIQWLHKVLSANESN